MVTRSARTISNRKPGTERQPSSQRTSPSRLDDLGVDDDRGAVALVQVVGEESLAHPDLRGGEPDARLRGPSCRTCRARAGRGRRRSPRPRAPRCFSTGSPKRRSGYMPPRYLLDPRAPSDQTRRGSTSMRRRPRVRAASTPGAARASAQRGRRSGARTSARLPVVDRAEHGDRARGGAPRRTRPPPPPASPLSSASPPNGGNPSASRRARSAPATTIGSPSARRAHHLVVGQPGLHEQPPGASPRSAGAAARAARAPARRPGPAAPAAPGRARGTRPGRRRRWTGRARRPRPTRCSTASVPTSTGTLGRPRRSTRRPTRPRRGAAARRGRRARA